MCFRLLYGIKPRKLAGTCLLSGTVGRIEAHGFCASGLMHKSVDEQRAHIIDTTPASAQKYTHNSGLTVLSPLAIVARAYSDQT